MKDTSATPRRVLGGRPLDEPLHDRLRLPRARAGLDVGRCRGLDEVALRPGERDRLGHCAGPAVTWRMAAARYAGHVKLAPELIRAATSWANCPLLIQSGVVRSFSYMACAGSGASVIACHCLADRGRWRLSARPRTS